MMHKHIVMSSLNWPLINAFNKLSQSLRSATSTSYLLQRNNNSNIYIMASILRRQPRLYARASIMPSGRSTWNATARRTYAKSSSDNPQGQGSSPDTNHPIPSNKAKPTLRDGNQSPMADQEGHLRDDLPEEVKRHNADVEKRYDRPYNHISDEGRVEQPWKKGEK